MERNIGNPKGEIRKPKEGRNPKSQIPSAKSQGGKSFSFVVLFRARGTQALNHKLRRELRR
jgi:hypothetical protein